MKTKKSTKFMLGMAASLLAISSMNAQTTTPQTQSQTDAVLNQTNAVSLITDGAGTSMKGMNLWGYMFGDYAYVSHGDSAGRGTKEQYKGLGVTTPGNPLQHSNAIEVRRAYLGLDYNINKHFGAYALLAYEGDYDVNNNRTVYLKYIYFKWKNIWKGTDLKIGQQATCSFANKYNTEPLLGYRCAEKTIMDMHGCDGSSDMAIALEGKIATFKSSDSTKQSAFIGYMAQMGDNSGNTPVPVFTGAGTSANATSDKLKKFRANVYFNCLNGGLTIGAYTDYLNYGNVPYGKSSTVFQQAQQTIKAYAAYNSKWFGIGGEWFQQTLKNGEVEVFAKVAGTQTGTNDTTNAVQGGFSVFAHGTIIQKKLNVFVRYDNYTPDMKYSYTAVTGSNLANSANESFTSRFTNIGGVSYKETFINAGIDWSPYEDKRIHFMPNIWIYQIANGYGSDNLKSDSYMVFRLTFLAAF